MEAEENNNLVRKSFVATNLSREAQHTMKWTIGTVIRHGVQDTVEDGGKIVADYKMAGELSGKAAAMGTSFVAINMPHAPGTLSLLSNIGDISKRSREYKMGPQEWCIAAEAIARLVGKLWRETETGLEVGVDLGVIYCRSPKRLLIEIWSL
ncbi:hypothetical protein C7212DRAFT_347946 [Tuber magnatum]|uniref:Uncharacterized protein n=1 Tax=Tuber magnatum TaxID=42249 RepID=A0A317SDS3_9PEZI|nr:hypothetical protein C7212DRAFT_347946 [Tuber magnatum]